MSKVTPHCVQKVHQDGTCSCTLQTMDTMGRVKGSSNEVITMELSDVTESRSPVPSPKSDQPLHIEPEVLQEMSRPTKIVSQSLIKIICLECNTMYDVKDDIQAIICKCGHQISFMVKKNAS